MNGKASRIALLLIALAASALLVQSLVGDDRGDGGEGATTGGAPAATPDATTGGGPAAADGAAPFDPLMGATPMDDGSLDPGADGDGKDVVSLSDVAPELTRREVGPPLDDGTPVDLTLRMTPGTRSRYRITNVIAQTDRSNGMSVGQRWTFDVSTRVEAVAEDGTARVRLTVDAVHIQALYPNGLQVDFDSRRPDEEMLAEPARAATVKPILAIVGVPVEFRVAPNGGCVGVEGLDAWHEAWIDAVESVQPGGSRTMVPPYTSETVLLEWSEFLFPPLLGGRLEAGEKRDVQILRDTLQAAYVEARGPLQATHDDGDVFRVRMTATPAALTRQGAPRSSQEAGVARVHVQSDSDAYYAAWRFARDPGRLVDAEIDTRYQLWVSWRLGEDANSQASYERVFLDVERLTRVELLSEE